jgi:hypothetical protein
VLSRYSKNELIRDASICSSVRAEYANHPTGMQLSREEIKERDSLGKGFVVESMPDQGGHIEILAEGARE